MHACACTQMSVYVCAFKFVRGRGRGHVHGCGCVGMRSCVCVCVGMHTVGMYGLFLALCEQCVYRYMSACMCKREGSIERRWAFFGPPPILNFLHYCITALLAMPTVRAMLVSSCCNEVQHLCRQFVLHRSVDRTHCNLNALQHTATQCHFGAAICSTLAVSPCCKEVQIRQIVISTHCNTLQQSVILLQRCAALLSSHLIARKCRSDTLSLQRTATHCNTVSSCCSEVQHLVISPCCNEVDIL